MTCIENFYLRIKAIISTDEFCSYGGKNLFGNSIYMKVILESILQIGQL